MRKIILFIFVSVLLNGCAEYSSWHEHLLSVNEDQKNQRTHGWRVKLIKFSQQGLEAFEWGLG